MVTGLEGALDPFMLAAAKGAGAGVARAAGVGAREVFRGRRRRKIRALTVGRAGLARKAALEALPAPTMSRLLDFCQSSAFEHAATSLARLYVTEGHGRKAGSLCDDLKSEFSVSLRLGVGEHLGDDVRDAVYAALNEVVFREVQQILAKPELAPGLEAEMLKTIGSLATACVRNTELLESLDELERFHHFEHMYRSQVAAVHATMKLPHAGTTRQVPYAQLFVEPAVRLHEKRADMQRHMDDLPVPQLLASATRAVILGDPGGGKSTLSRKLTHDLAAGALPELGVTRTPFFVELRDYATVVRGRKRRTLVEYLEGLCRSPYNIEPPSDAIEWMLLNDRAMVILDGLDELLDTSLRRDVVEAVEGFAHRYPTCPMLVTSRRVGYTEAPLDPDMFPSVQLSEFRDGQVRAYVSKWFRLDESVDADRQDALAESFMTDSVFVADLRVNPLMLSLMCGIYASENYIPRNRPDVYEKCALLLFERWDKQRGIAAPLPFDAHVQAAMRSLALYMYKLEAEAGSSPTGGADEAREVQGIHRSKLVDYMRNYLREKRFDDDESAETAAVQFIEFCKGRAWVLTDIGSDTYGFTHQTFLEYFAASQLVRENTSAVALYAQLRPHIRSGGWDVVAQLAVQILGRATEDGADDFLELVVDDVTGTTDADYYAVSFALRAMHFVVPRPSIVRAIVESAFDLHDPNLPAHLGVGLLGGRRAPRKVGELGLRLLSELMSVSSENAPRVGDALRKVLQERIGVSNADAAVVDIALAPLRRDRLMYAFPGEYWITWAGENLTEFAGVITAARPSLGWVALAELERGKVTLRQVLEWHGVEVLFDFDHRGLEPPFFYRFLFMRSRGGFRGTLSMVKPSRATVLAEQLSVELSKWRTPWLTRDTTGQRLHWVVEEGAGWDVHKVGPAGLLLALPLLEARLRPDDGPVRVPLGPPSGWARTLLEVRTKDAPIETASALLDGVFGKGSSAPRDFVDMWLQGDVDVSRPGRSARRARRAGPALRAQPVPDVLDSK